MNAMPVFKCRTFLGALVFFVTACVPQIEIVFYNHSGKDLTISGTKTAHQVRKDDVVTIHIYELAPTFHITDGLNDWEFNLDEVPREYLVHGFSASRLRCQIEPNGTIHVVDKDDGLPMEIAASPETSFPFTRL